MCRSIKTLRPPYAETVTDADVRAAALQFVRKVAGMRTPAPHNAVVFKAAVDEVLGGVVSRVADYAVRFAGVVYPGETLVVQLWREPDRIALRVFAKPDGLLELRP